MRAGVRWPQLLSGLGVAAVVLALARSRDGGTLFEQLSLGRRPPVREYSAFAVVSVSDCDGYLETLSLLERPSISQYVSLAGAWYVGRNRDSTRIKAALTDQELHVEVRHAPDRAVRALQHIGITSTPVLLVFDRRGALRATFPLLAGPEQRLSFIRALQDLPH